MTLASGQSYPNYVAVDATNVYWTTENSGTAGEAFECANGGCASPMVLGSGVGGHGIASDGTDVFWVAPSSVNECAVAGCNDSPTVLVAGQSGGLGLGLDAANVYWTSQYDGTVKQCARTGCASTLVTLASGQQNPYGLAVDATNVYWVNNGDGTVMKCSIGGCGGSPTTLATGQNGPLGIAVDASNVYWTSSGNGTVMTCAIGGCGGSPTTLVPGQGTPYAIAVDQNNVYWTTGSGVLWCPRTGCVGLPMHLGGGGLLSSVALDSSCVYWVDQELQGSVMKVGKP